MPLSVSDIEYVKKQYLCCTPANKFRFTESEGEPDTPLDYEAQMKIFENTIGDSESVKYPSRLSYRISFLRALIEKVFLSEVIIESETDGGDIYDKLYETLTDYMMLDDGENCTHYRQFLLKRGDPERRIIVRESKHLISEGTTGLRTWQAGFALAEWCDVNRASIKDKRVLELGSGVGLTGLSVITTCSPGRYTFSDCHPRVLDTIVQNVRLNFGKNSEAISEDPRTVEWREQSYRITHENTDVGIIRLEWSSIGENDANASWTKPDVVLASDVIYDDRIFDEFIQGVRVFIRRSNALVIVATTVRNHETLAEFFNKLDTYGLSYADETLPRPNLFLQLDETPVRIFKIFNKK